MFRIVKKDSKAYKKITKYVFKNMPNLKCVKTNIGQNSKTNYNNNRHKWLKMITMVRNGLICYRWSKR